MAKNWSVLASFDAHQLLPTGRVVLRDAFGFGGPGLTQAGHRNGNAFRVAPVDAVDDLHHRHAISV
jgi:hypothetical protein